MKLDDMYSLLPQMEIGESKTFELDHIADEEEKKLIFQIAHTIVKPPKAIALYWGVEGENSVTVKCFEFRKE